MCGRYTLAAAQRPELQHLGLSLSDRFNIAPQSDVLVQLDSGVTQFLRWDFSPAWAKAPLHITNARAETLSEKPAFRGVHRCAFVADGWYEWQRESGKKVPWYHHCEGSLLHFAGIYLPDGGCAIVTTQAQSDIAHVHHRQPLLLGSETLNTWFGGAHPDECLVTVPIRVHQVSPRVNRASIDEPSLTAPVSSQMIEASLGITGDLFAE